MENRLKNKKKKIKLFNKKLLFLKAKDKVLNKNFSIGDLTLKKAKLNKKVL
jgi:hypothetical protein